MEKKKVAVIALVVVFIVVISVIVITRNLDKNASTEVALVYEDVATEEAEINEERENELVVSEEEEAIEESEVVEEESTGETPVVVEESEAIEEEPVVEEVKSIYTDVNYVRYAKTSLNVRQGLGADTEKIGSLSQNQEVTVIGEVSNSDWVLISYGNGNEGHVNKSYLSDTKTVVASTPKTNNNTGTSSQGSTTDNSSQTTQPTDNSSQTPSNPSSSNDPLLDIIQNGGNTEGFGESPIYW